MSSNLKKYLPPIYNEVLETNALIAVEDSLFDDSEEMSAEVRANNFVKTANLRGIQYYEEMLSILADPTTQGLEFRRDRVMNRYAMVPPFTMPFMRQRLDEIIGIGKWDAYIDQETLTLYIESAAENQSWFEEILVTVTRLKPANIVFVNKPLITDKLKLSEKIHSEEVVYNYRLGATWNVGQKAFMDFMDTGVAKMANVPSIGQALLNGLASFTADSVASVLLNDTIEITSFLTKEVVENVLTIEYEVVAPDTEAITSIKLLNTEADILTSSVVFVPVSDNMVLKHIFQVVEGV